MLISVVIPVYNAALFLDKAIVSVLKQTYKQIDIVLVDDGSTDLSKKKCQSFASKDNRVRIVSQQNQGPAAARNTGVRHALGEFIFFLDADDYLSESALEKLICAYEKFKADLVIGNFCKLENNGKIINQKVSFSPQNIPFDGHEKELSRKDLPQYVRHFLKYPSNHLISYCWGRLYKLSIIKEWTLTANEKMRLFEDFTFNLEYLKHTDKVVLVNEPLYTYSMHNSHISASMSIVNAENLLHDMCLFREKTRIFFNERDAQNKDNYDIEQEIGHTLIHYVIIFLIRSCRLSNCRNRKFIAKEIKQIIQSSIYRESLLGYKPLQGNNRIIPILSRIKALPLIISYCKYKAMKRYGKLPNVATKKNSE